MPYRRTVGDAGPYSFQRTAFQIVGAAIGRPHRTHHRIHDNPMWKRKMLRFCHPERSETEPKDLRLIDTAKILRFAPLTQDDR